MTTNPKETIEGSFDLPKGTLGQVDVQIFEEKPRTIGIVIPPRPDEPGAELSDELLDVVAGGVAPNHGLPNNPMFPAPIKTW